MKRIFSVVMIALMGCFAFAGCSGNTQDGGNSSEDKANTAMFDSSEKPTPEKPIANNKIFITIGDNTVLTATLVENSATEVLKERLMSAPITIDMEDYGGWEKVGGFGFSLPTSNSQITAEPCEFVLYQGNQLVIFYGSNSWSYTRLGKIDNITQAELKEILGSGNVTVTLSLK